MNHPNKIQGHTFALLANVMWGLMAPIGKSALQVFHPLSLTTFRMVGAAIAFWILSAFFKSEPINRTDRLRILFASFFALIFNQGVFIYGLSLTSPIDASIVTTMLPIITMIVAAFYLKEPVTNKKIIGIIMGALGAITLIISSHQGSTSESNLLGNLLCLSGQFSFAIYLTVFKNLTQHYSAITINKWMFLYAACCYLPFSFQELIATPWVSIPPIAFWQVAYVVLGGSFLAYLLLMTAQRILRPTVVSMYNYMQPIMATIAALIMGIGTFGWSKGIAISFVFGGVYMVTKSKSRADIIQEKLNKSS
ncbi:MAG: DMT family transporter [Bacteroides sp.]